MSFLEGDISELGLFGRVDETNVIEFIDKMVETLSYKLTSVAIAKLQNQASTSHLDGGERPNAS